MAEGRGAGIAAGVTAGVLSAGYSGLKALAWADRRRHHVSPEMLDDAMADLGEPAGARHRTITSRDGGRIHVVEHGDPSATPIVLLHGVTLAASIWNHQLGDLADRHRVVAFDWRGHGRSLPGTGGYGLDLLADDLDLVLETLDLTRAVLVGHSMGGMAMMHFCRRNKQTLYRRVVGLVFQSTAASDVASGPASGVFRLGRVFAKQQPELAGKLYQAVPGDLGYAGARLGFGRNPSPLWIEQTRTLLAAMSPTAIARSTLALLDHDERKVLPSLELPALVLVGSSDLVTPPRQARDIADRIPGARLHEFDDAGHLLMLERREELANEVAAFTAHCLPRPARRAARH